MKSLGICPERRTGVVVAGGGMAGVWAAYQLVKAGVATVLVTYGGSERGGVQGSSRRSVGAFNCSPLTHPDFGAYLAELGKGQAHPSVARTMREYFRPALDELAALVDLRPIKIGLALGGGGGAAFLELMYRRFEELGGERIDGWVTRIVADEQRCCGLQYESAAGVGKVRCAAMILASGGYAGLFSNSIPTYTFGSVLGYYLQAGGVATNLEFLFKHGYGNVDTRALTPTEELPGAEISDSNQRRVVWLEQLLFHGQGTKSHLQAVQFWLRNHDVEFYVDLSYRPLYLKLSGLNVLLERGGEPAGAGGLEGQVREVVGLFAGPARERVERKIVGWLETGKAIGYDMFEELKADYQPGRRARFRVQPLTYFSMGGIGHVEFGTNLKNVFVTGEAMHDFGADRVGGLPWSLYLAAGLRLRERIQEVVNGAGTGAAGDFELIEKRSVFDGGLLREIQERLYECQEKELTASRARACIDWLRQRRLELLARTESLHDAISWLIVAEAIMQSSLCRPESRGFFFRFDYQTPNEKLDHLYSCAWYDARAERVEAELAPWREVELRICRRRSAEKRACVYREDL